MNIRWNETRVNVASAITIGIVTLSLPLLSLSPTPDVPPSPAASTSYVPTTAAYGPNHDYAPLLREYEDCAYNFPTSYFLRFVCTSGAYNRALHPTLSV